MIINDTSIYMTRGDSESMTVSCTDADGKFLPLVTGDKVYFTVKTSIDSLVNVLQKFVTVFSDGKAVIEIAPIDTKTIAYGKYLYDVQISKADGSITTIIKPSRFEIGGEITNE